MKLKMISLDVGVAACQRAWSYGRAICANATGGQQRLPVINSQNSCGAREGGNPWGLTMMVQLPGALRNVAMGGWGRFTHLLAYGEPPRGSAVACSVPPLHPRSPLLLVCAYLRSISQGTADTKLPHLVVSSTGPCQHVKFCPSQHCSNKGRKAVLHVAACFLQVCMGPTESLRLWCQASLCTDAAGRAAREGDGWRGVVVWHEGLQVTSSVMH